jgi:hypothetical protein
MKRKNLILLLLLIIAITATFFLISQPEKHHIDYYIDKSAQDTLLVNVVTHMGIRPKHADYNSRFQPQYRRFYINQSENYNFYRYFADDQYHYFYMIRPARHAQGNRRAIGGKMKLDSLMNILDYEEVFVTRVMQEDSLIKIAPTLFDALSLGRDLQDFIQNDLVEWPDAHVRYNKQIKHWSLELADNQ